MNRKPSDSQILSWVSPPYEIEEAEAPYEIAHLRPESTGLPMTIWVSERGGAKHGLRINVSFKLGAKIDLEERVTVTIEDEPRVSGDGHNNSDYAVVSEYIASNRDVLFAYWNGEVDTAEMLERLRWLE